MAGHCQASTPGGPIFSGFTCLHPHCQPALSTCFLQLGCHHYNHKSAFILFNQIYQASHTKTIFAIVKANLPQLQLMRLIVLLLRVHLVVIKIHLPLIQQPQLLIQLQHIMVIQLHLLVIQLHLLVIQLHFLVMQ